jgi:hypothetical protein
MTYYFFNVSKVQFCGEFFMHDQNCLHNHLDSRSPVQTMYGELLCHLPYAIFSVTIGLVVLSCLTALMLGFHDPSTAVRGAKVLFHSFHFMHIIFATTGTLITYFRFSKKIVPGLLIGIFSPAFFCTMSDAVIPYLGARMLGVTMKLHLCFLTELPNVLPFLLVGILNGFLLRKNHHDTLTAYGLSSHAIHITISSLASMFYLVSHGFSGWYHQIGVVFLMLILAVVIPCTFSDIVVPIFVARRNYKQ